MYPTIRTNIRHATRQQMQILGINHSDNYTDGQLDDCVNINTDRFPYITTCDKLTEVQGLSGGYNAVSMFAWEQMFVVSDGETKELSPDTTPVTDDLTETVWLFNSSVNMAEGVWAIDFISKGREYNSIGYNQAGTTGISYTFPNAMIHAYDLNTGWTLEGYRTIRILGGADAVQGEDNRFSELLAYLQDNATLQGRMVVTGYKCYYGGNYCGDMPTLELPKQYAIVNAQLVVYPDKVYFDLNDENIEPHPLDTASLIGSGTVTFEALTEDHPARIVFPDSSITSQINTAHQILVQGAKTLTLNASYIIDSITNSSGNYYVNIKSDFLMDSDHSEDISLYDAGEEGEFGIAPDLDYICASDNRVWGVNSEQRTIYASALGDATDFHSYEGLDTDAYAVAVGSAGEFTGCVALQNTVLFFKQHTIHKLLGGYPSEYVMYEYQLDGISPTNGLAAVNCNGTAVYPTEHGMGTYYGSSSGSLSKDIKAIYNGVAMYDGERYYLSCTGQANGSQPHLYVFDMRYNIWTKIADIHPTCLVHLGDTNYMLLGGKIYMINSGTATDGSWSMLFKDMIETQTGAYQSRTSIFNKKRYWKYYVRVALPKGSTFVAEYRTDNRGWHPVGRLSGETESVKVLYFRTLRSDKIQLRLSGTGPMTIYAIEREFTEGSTR